MKLLKKVGRADVNRGTDYIRISGYPASIEYNSLTLFTGRFSLAYLPQHPSYIESMFGVDGTDELVALLRARYHYRVDREFTIYDSLGRVVKLNVKVNRNHIRLRIGEKEYRLDKDSDNDKAKPSIEYQYYAALDEQSGVLGLDPLVNRENCPSYPTIVNEAEVYYVLKETWENRENGEVKEEILKSEISSKICKWVEFGIDKWVEIAVVGLLIFSIVKF